ncbi:unnamed protein product [Closterium sp. Yama58-4]|nr:unnamed protein product [Closterium sp. Yama58-4]
MDKIFGPAYTGDPGVPHTDKDIFSGIFWGAVGFSLYSVADPYYWQHSTEHNWHDMAYIHENHQFKKACRQRKPYEPKWNQMMSKEVRESYYNNWRDYFP